MWAENCSFFIIINIIVFLFSFPMENVEISPNNENLWPRALHFSSEMLPCGSCSWYALCPCCSLWADIPGWPTSLMVQHGPLSCWDNAMYRGSHVTMVLCEKCPSHGKPSTGAEWGHKARRWQPLRDTVQRFPSWISRPPATLKPCWEIGHNFTQNNFAFFWKAIFHWKIFWWKISSSPRGSSFQNPLHCNLPT